MKKISGILLVICCVLILFCLAPVAAHAQVGDPGCDPLDPTCPVDGGVVALLAIGIGYGIKKINTARKQQGLLHK